MAILVKETNFLVRAKHEFQYTGLSILIALSTLSDYLDVDARDKIRLREIEKVPAQQKASDSDVKARNQSVSKDKYKLESRKTSKPLAILWLF